MDREFHHVIQYHRSCLLYFWDNGCTSCTAMGTMDKPFDRQGRGLWSPNGSYEERAIQLSLTGLVEWLRCYGHAFVGKVQLCQKFIEVEFLISYSNMMVQNMDLYTLNCCLLLIDI